MKIIGAKDIDSIKGAALLSKEEYKEYKSNIHNIRDSWWLRSWAVRRNCDYAFYVNNINSYVGWNYYNNIVYYDDVGVRPVLEISSNMDIGDKIKFGDHTFTMISNNLALCDGVIGKCAFHEDYEAKEAHDFCKAEDANDYETSDVKKYVDNWFERTKEKIKEADMEGMKTYLVPFAYERYGRIQVEARTEEEAVRLAEDELVNMSLYDMDAMSDYLEDSLTIDEEGQILEVDGRDEDMELE